MIRKAICFLLAGGMLAGGLYLLYLQVFFSTVIYGRALLLAGMLIGVGAVWLLYDFLIPWWRGEEVG